MTREAQELAIAVFCGKKPMRVGYVCLSPDKKSTCMTASYADYALPKSICENWISSLPPDSPFKNYTVEEDLLYPDYLSDLNAMHEAEKVLKGGKEDEYGELAEYHETLCLVCGDRMEPLNVYEIDLIRATAAQRAEAFLRTVGRWVDSTLASEPVQR